jgi:hypothetical protein
MKNVEIEVKDNILTIKVDLTQDHGKSSSGKTNIIATSEGNAALPTPYEHVKMGLNVYKKP